MRFSCNIESKSVHFRHFYFFYKRKKESQVAKKLRDIYDYETLEEQQFRNCFNEFLSSLRNFILLNIPQNFGWCFEILYSKNFKKYCSYNFLTLLYRHPLHKLISLTKDLQLIII